MLGRTVRKLIFSLRDCENVMSCQLFLYILYVFFKSLLQYKFLKSYFLIWKSFLKTYLCHLYNDCTYSLQTEAVFRVIFALYIEVQLTLTLVTLWH